MDIYTVVFSILLTFAGGAVTGRYANRYHARKRDSLEKRAEIIEREGQLIQAIGTSTLEYIKLGVRSLVLAAFLGVVAAIFLVLSQIYADYSENLWATLLNGALVSLLIATLILISTLQFIYSSKNYKQTYKRYKQKVDSLRKRAAQFHSKATGDRVK